MKGGKRKGAGRKAGGKNRATLEKEAVLAAFNQRVMQKADVLFNAQLSLAVGSMKVFRIDEEGEGAKKKRVHVHVTDADEIKALLDEHDGGAGIVEGVYYYFADVLPDNRAIDSLMTRTFGRPTEHVKHEILDPKKLASELLEELQQKYRLPLDQARSIVLETCGDVLQHEQIA